MPSLRNPVGPLPSSIYWRRRLVVLVVLAAVLALLLWLLLPGGGGKNPGASGPTSSGPAVSITPGTSAPGSSSDGKAGGTSGTPSSGASGSAGPSSSPSATAPAGNSGGTVVSGGSGSGGTGSTGSTGGGTGSTGGGTGGSAPQANGTGTMQLPVCAAADVELALTSTEHTYDSSQWPTFQLAVTNSSGAACRVDLGARSAVLTVSSGSSGHVWSSGDCPKVTAAQWYAVPASGAPLDVRFVWGRTTSAPGCTPGGGGGAVGAGTYVATIGLDGVPIKPLLQFKLAPFGS